MNLFYLLGAPGSGKTTLMKYLTRHWVAQSVTTPFAHLVYSPDLIQLGGNREPFGGTDVLPLNIQPAALQWLAACPYSFVLGEGARLGNSKFLRAVRQFATVHVVYLNTPENICTQRRNARGHTFHKAFVKGAQTRAQHTALQFIRDPQWFLDGTLPVETLAAQLQTHPFFMLLR